MHKRFALSYVQDVLSAFVAKRISACEAQAQLTLGKSQFYRMAKIFRKDPGSFSLDYKRTTPNHTLSAEKDAAVRRILDQEYALIADPNLPIDEVAFQALSDELRRVRSMHVSAETIRTRAISWKLHTPKQRGIKIYREVVTMKIGQLFQHDTCFHQWSPYMEHFYLILTVDDHSRRIVYARFFSEESSMNHILSTKAVVEAFGIPTAYYTDRHSIFTYNEKQASTRAYRVATEDADVQWRRVMRLLGIQPILARSPQAKGKVESKFSYLQRRMVRRCAKEEVRSIADAQRILDQEVQYYNDSRLHEITGQAPTIRWEKAVKEGRTALRPFLLLEGQSWKDTFCLEYFKTVDSYGKIRVKKLVLELKKSPTKQICVHYIAYDGKVEVRLFSGKVLLQAVSC